MEYWKILLILTFIASCRSLPVGQYEAAEFPFPHYEALSHSGDSPTLKYGEKFRPSPSRIPRQNIADKYGLDDVSATGYHPRSSFGNFAGSNRQSSKFGGRSSSKYEGQSSSKLGGQSSSQFGGHSNAGYSDLSGLHGGGLSNSQFSGKSSSNFKGESKSQFKEESSSQYTDTSSSNFGVNAGARFGGGFDSKANAVLSQRDQGDYDNSHISDFGHNRNLHNDGRSKHKHSHEQSYNDDHSYKPAKYKFDYTVKDDYGNHFGHEETRDGHNTKGSYHVFLPDGRKQIVTYYVDGDSGFVAEVTYEGEAQYPEYEPNNINYKSQGHHGLNDRHGFQSHLGQNSHHGLGHDNALSSEYGAQNQLLRNQNALFQSQHSSSSSSQKSSKHHESKSHSIQHNAQQAAASPYSPKPNPSYNATPVPVYGGATSPFSRRQIPAQSPTGYESTQSLNPAQYRESIYS